QVHPQPVTPYQAGDSVGSAVANDVAREGNALANRVAPTPTTPEMAGRSVIAKFQSEIARFKAQADQAYSRAWRVAKDRLNVKQVQKQVETPQGWDTVPDPDGNGGREDMQLPNDMRPMKMALRPIAKAYARTMDPTKRNASLGLSTMYDIIKGPDFKTLL